VKIADAFLSAAPPPSVAVEIARHRVSAVSVGTREGGLTVTAHASETLSPGSVLPSLTNPNIPNPRAVVDAMGRVFERIDARPKRIALAVPDAVAKVSLLRFEKVPARESDLDELVRWQIRKAAPFRIEEAQLSYAPAMTAPDGATEFIVTMARTDIIREYESICEELGAQAGIVDLATFNVINAVLAGSHAPAEDWLLVHVTPTEATMAILRGSHLVFFRNRGADDEGSLADMVHQTAMYYEDRLSGASFSRVMLAGASSPHSGQDADYLRRALEQRLGTRVDPVDPRNAATLMDRISASGEALDALAPLVGLMARARAA
jgi:hypothetical protein